jgi:hypothetical protein
VKEKKIDTENSEDENIDTTQWKSDTLHDYIQNNTFLETLVQILK